jgi:urease accessory protein
MPEFSGHLHLRATARADGTTVLGSQSFRAPFHLSKPYWDPDARTLQVQVVNPTAGILEGDRLESEIFVDRGAALLLTTPSASRVFRMQGGAAASEQRIRVAAGGWFEMLPEPLVPHRGSVFRQSTTLDVDSGAAVVYVDQLLAGRVGHGEAWLWSRLRVELALRLDGRLILQERLDTSGPELAALARLHGFGAAAGFANAVILAPSASEPHPAWVNAVADLHGPDAWLGISALKSGGWCLRVIARDSIALRATLGAVRAILARPLPHCSSDLRKL